MGICYYLVKVVEKEAFDLDKGSWFEAFPSDLEFHITPDFNLLGKIDGGVYQKEYFLHRLAGDYAEWLAAKIRKWAGDARLRLLNDCADDLCDWDGDTLKRRYKTTATRFEDGSQADLLGMDPS